MDNSRSEQYIWCARVSVYTITVVYMVCMNIAVYHDVETLWKYMVLDEPARSADVLLVLGSIDERVAKYATELTNLYDYSCVVFSGGIAHAGDMLHTTWSESEAEHFYTVFCKMGGKSRRVLLETQSENTGQNATLSCELLQHENVPMKTMQVVTKPYMLRRARATFEAQWPVEGTEFFMSGPNPTLHEYLGRDQPFDALVNIMVGDFQRIVEYPKRGLQTAQDIPKDVMHAWVRLVSAGYDKHFIQ